jgi:scyllo-inositol 2-dehydrogenase (NADP+)
MKRFKTARDIRVGIIGFGGMARWHIMGLKKAGLTLAAVTDVVSAHLDEAKKECPGIETYSTLSAMLKKGDVDVVLLITPHDTHARLAVQCLNAGKPVICEKPLAITTAECDRMIAAAQKNKVFVTAFHNRHWDGLILNALKKIRAGLIGDVIRVEAHWVEYGCPNDTWRSSKSHSGGVLYDWGVHLLEWVLQIADSEIVEVTGFAKPSTWAPKTRWKEDTIEDEGLAMMRFANGMWASLCISNIDVNHKRGVLEITGTKGTLICGHTEWESIVIKGKKKIITKGPNPKDEWHRFYANIRDHFISGAKLAISPEWARRPIHVLDLANQSAKQGKSLSAKHK